MNKQLFFKKVISLLILPVLFFSLISCSKTAKVDTSPLFWKIQSAESTLYVLGSIHVATPDIYPLDSVIMDAYKGSEYIMFETDILSERSERPPDKNSVQELVGKDLYEKTKATIKALHPELTDDEINNANFNGLVEWLMKSSYSKTGLSPEHGIDIYFMQKAFKDGKKLLGVESYSQQSEDMANHPPDYMTYTLSALLDVEMHSESLNLTFEQWCNGDIAAIEESQIIPLRQERYNSDLVRYLYEFSILERNSRMLQRCQEQLSEKETTFFVAGLAHMLGEEGIINQFEQLGYQVELIPT